eukprot:978780-Alexandrium_andersonii.AAC.1
MILLHGYAAMRHGYAATRQERAGKQAATSRERQIRGYAAARHECHKRHTDTHTQRHAFALPRRCLR